MRTRSQSKTPQTAGAGEQEAREGLHVSESIDDNEALSNISRNAVGKLLKRVKKRFNKEDVSYLRHCESSAKRARESKDNNKNSAGTPTDKGQDRSDPVSYSKEAMENPSNPEKDDGDNGYEDSEWEDGSIPTLSSIKGFREDLVDGIFVEFDVSHGVAKRKPVRRATAEEKEVSEFVHKAHLLCLLGRGRLIDSACNDPLIQASLLSLVPAHLLKIEEFSNLTANRLYPLVDWFHKNFHVRSPNVAEKSCHLALSTTLETREGTSEAVAALSVALFRALNLTTRFVSILDVISLKPDADKSESRERDLFSSSTLMVAGPSCSSAYTAQSPLHFEDGSTENADESSKHDEVKSHDSLNTDKPKDNMPVSEVSNDTSESCLEKSKGLKRKGDFEFQMQMEMALAATAVGNPDINVTSNASESPSTLSLTPPSKRLKRIRKEEFSTGISTAIGSKKVGAPLYWAEVFCSGDNLTGKWVHVDAVNAIIDGEHKVEAGASACKKSLRYVVAFAGNGAKDVTRRYCSKWYKVSAQRVNSTWWDSVLEPLKELESRETAGVAVNVGSHMINSFAPPTRSSLEDMELETRALTEPLPTNQQAYRNHHLYVIERCLKKYEILYPKGTVLGFCGGHPVYPRTCVKALHTKERWLREGLQVKAAEVPVKVVKRSLKSNKEDVANDNDYNEGDQQGITSLYGKWQTEPLCLPQAVNGIVPKNERGQVDVWSEKCLPPGTVHLPFPRVAAVARRLGVDFAPAMVGFDFRNGRSLPVFEGIVVCSEFKRAILEAYFEEEERREAVEKRRNEAQALSRWYQLLSSIITRQRLNECYGDGASSIQMPKSGGDKYIDSAATTTTSKTEVYRQLNTTSPEGCEAPEAMTAENHEHEFIILDEKAIEVATTRVKRCSCGFSIQFEEL